MFKINSPTIKIYTLKITNDELGLYNPEELARVFDYNSCDKEV